MKTEEEKTKEINDCNSFADLEKAIRNNAPFISNSRDIPVEWDADAIIRRIFVVIDGVNIDQVTPANGLRHKVGELLKKRGIVYSYSIGMDKINDDIIINATN